MRCNPNVNKSLSTTATMNLFIARPDSDMPVPGVVVIQHQYGVDQFTEDMTARTGAEGYFAVCPDLYHRDGPDCKDDGPTRRGRVRDYNIIKDVNAAVSYLKGQKGSIAAALRSSDFAWAAGWPI